MINTSIKKIFKCLWIVFTAGIYHWGLKFTLSVNKNLKLLGSDGAKKSSVFSISVCIASTPVFR